MQQDQTKKDFLKFWEHIPWKSQDETLIVLKGHLLIEDLMREYCASKVDKSSELEKAKLTFPQVSYLTRSLQKYEAPSWVWGAVSKLNGLRNGLAHNLTPRNYESKRDEFTEFVRSENKGDLFEQFPRDFERLGVAIFMIYTALSVNLRFKPKGLLTLAMELDDSKSSNN